MPTTEDLKRFNQALQLQLNGLWLEAMQVYSELLSLYPNRRSLLINLIKCCESIKDLVGIRVYAKKLYQHYPNDTAVIQTFMEAMLLVGDPCSAKDCYETINQTSLRETFRELGIKTYLLLEDAPSAKKIIDQTDENLERTCLYNYMCGVTYKKLGDLENSIAAYARIERTSPLYLKARLELTLSQREIGIFENDEEIINLLNQFSSDTYISAYEAPNPFTALHFPLSEIAYRKIAEAGDNRPARKEISRPKNPALRDRIKLAYVSPDFRDHAVGYLIEPVLKSHNREKFYLIGLDLCPDPNQGFRKQLLNYFDKVIKMTDLDEEEIDIAIDLAGPTRGSVPGLFERQIAKKQLIWLGYPGTSGKRCYDGIIADRYVLPPESARHFTEPVIYMPDCYQPFDVLAETHYVIRSTPHKPRRFRFGSLNNVVKINKNILETWGAILDECNNSEMHIFVSNKDCANAIESIFNRMGINSDRLACMYPTAHDKHLERLKDIDLVLDTWPFNGHTTTQDALRCKVPVLTVQGEAFQARVAGSILRYCGLPSYIASDIVSYKEKAVAFYRTFENSKATGALPTITPPSIKKFTMDLESIYINLLDE